MKKLLIFSLAINIIGLCVFAGRRLYFKNKPKVDDVEAYNVLRSNIYGSLPTGEGSIIFIGNSLTEGFPLYELFPGANIKNRGISANRTSHVVGRIEPIARTRPAKIFIEIGINDLANKITIDSITKNYNRIFKIIQTESPSTQIFVQSVFPVCMEYANLKDSVLQLNGRLKQLCMEKQATYVDVYAALSRNTYLDSSITYDGIHLNGKGYNLWASLVKDLVR